MKDYAYFYKDENGDRVYDAEDMTDWLTPFFTTGVFNGNLQVTANNNMTVTIGTGYCNVNGKVKHFINQTTLDLETASGTLNRIDNVILRRDDTQRDIYLMIVTGGNAATPTTPVLVRNDNIYDLKLAEIYIQAGTIKVTQANITDTRMNSAVCGWVAATVTEIEFAQITAQFQTYMEEFEAGDKAEFEAWFLAMKDQLTTDAAGNLQAQINTANTNIATTNAQVAAVSTNLDHLRTLKGVNVATYGTSITWGQTIPNPPYHTEINWPKTFAEITGCNMFNKAMGGSCMAATGDATNVNSFCNRVDTEDFSNYDYLILEYGTNDYGYNIPIGNDSSNSKNTFVGALRYSIMKLLTMYPDLKITLMTPLFANTSYVKNPTTGHTMLDYANAVIEVATRFCIPVIDLHNGMGVNTQNIAALYWDGALHPSEATYIRMGTFIAQSFPGAACRSIQPVYWKTLTLQNGASLAVPSLAASYCIDSNQFVHFRGIVTVPVGAAFITLPEEARPSYSHSLPVSGGVNGIAVFTDGRLSSPVATSYDLAGIPPFFVGHADVI